MLQPNIAASKTTDVIDTLKADHKHEQIHICPDWVWVQELRCFMLPLNSGDTCPAFSPTLLKLLTTKLAFGSFYETENRHIWEPTTWLETAGSDENTLLS